MKIKRSLLSFLIILSIIFSSCFVYADTSVDTISAFSDESKDYRSLVSDAIEGACGAVTDMHFSWDWAAVGLSRAGKADKIYGNYLSDIESFLKNPENEDLFLLKPTEYERMTLGVLSAGGDPTNVGGINMIEKIYTADLERQGNNAMIFALIAFDAGNYIIPENAKWTRDKLIAEILKQECTNEETDYGKNGGWAFSGTTGDPDMTGMAMTAFAPYYGKRSDVTEAVDRAIEYLSTIQREDGGYASWGTVNSESCAQVIMGLCTNGFDPAGPQFTKNGNTIIDAILRFKNDDGVFWHILDPEHLGHNGMSTEQALYALDQYMYYLDGKGSIYWWGDKNTNTENQLGVQVKLEQGKTVSFKDGISVSLGENVVPSNAFLTVSDKSSDAKYQPSQESGLSIGGKILEYKLEGMQITKPVEIKIPVNTGANTDKASIYYYNEGLKKWEYAASKYDDGIFASNVDHFSVYGVLIDRTAPINVQLKLTSNTKNAVVLGLGAEDASGIKEYEIYRNDTLIGKTAQSSYTDTAAESGKTYSYKILAVDNLNNKSAYSTNLDVTVPSGSSGGGSSGGKSGGGGGGGGGGSSTSADTTSTTPNSDNIATAVNNISANSVKLSSDADITRLLADTENVLTQINKAAVKGASGYNLTSVLDSCAKLTDALGAAGAKTKAEDIKQKLADMALRIVNASQQVMNNMSDKDKLEEKAAKIIEALTKLSKLTNAQTAQNIQKSISVLALRAIELMSKEALSTSDIKTEGTGIKANIAASPDKISRLAARTVRAINIIDRKVNESGLERNKWFEKAIIIDIPSEGKNKVEAVLPAGLLKNMPVTGISKLKLNTSLGILSIIPEAFAEADKAKEISITISKLDPAQEKGNSIIGFEIKAGGQSITSLAQPFEASITYSGTVKKAEAVTAFIQKTDGKEAPAGGRYEPETKQLKLLVEEAGKYSVKEHTKQFKDMDKAKWAVDAVEILAGKGILSGKTDSTFEPNANVTRAEFTDFIVKMLKCQADNKALNFKDVDKNYKYYDSIAAGCSNGLISGANPESFNPDGSITRQEMASIISKVLIKKGYISANASKLDILKDKAAVADWAKASVATVVREGIITGTADGSFAPNDKVTRAQAAVILNRLQNIILQ